MWVGALRVVASDRRHVGERKLLPSAECGSRTGACSPVPSVLAARRCARVHVHVHDRRMSHVACGVQQKNHNP